MTKNEKSKADTLAHIKNVRRFLYNFERELRVRRFVHDYSKLKEPELSLFAEWGPKLKQMEYGSKEYKSALAEMGKALQHHYEHNRHHPEHFGEKGVDGMNLVDLVEMICDWKAASMRVKNGNFADSLEIQRKRFGLNNQLVGIILNSVTLLEK